MQAYKATVLMWISFQFSSCVSIIQWPVFIPGLVGNNPLQISGCPKQPPPQKKPFFIVLFKQLTLISLQIYFRDCETSCASIIF